ncbi:hypothetical protein C5167_028374 [Papaver somniferum]|nr:hypothetical protein C5167_028374 [Papaver somniferum]
MRFLGNSSKVQAYNVQDQGGHLKDGSLEKNRPTINHSCAFFEWNIELKPMDSTTMKMPPYKFCFTAFEELNYSVGDSTSELSWNLDQDGVEYAPIVDVVTGKLSLSSTNSTKIYLNIELPEVMDMRQRCCQNTPPIR